MSHTAPVPMPSQSKQEKARQSKTVLVASVIIVVAFCLCGALFPEGTADAVAAVNSFLTHEVGWLSSWTIFYWGWWIAWATFCGQFFARLSKSPSCLAPSSANRRSPHILVRHPAPRSGSATESPSTYCACSLVQIDHVNPSVGKSMLFDCRLQVPTLIDRSRPRHAASRIYFAGNRDYAPGNAV